MSKLEYVYVTYIETTPEQLWKALTDGDFTERYWYGHRVSSDWQAGSSYRFTKDGANTIEGSVIAADPPRRLIYNWNPCLAETRAEGVSRVTFDLEPRGKVVKLTVTHDELHEGGKTLRAISGGWPMVIASLKSFLESGRALPRDLPTCGAKETADA